MNKNKRIDEIYKHIIELASGNYKSRLKESDANDEMDAIVAGINMLAEEIEYSTISRDYMNSIYKGIVDMVIVLETDNTIREVNTSVCNTLSYNKKELLGKPFDMLLEKDKRDSIKKINNELNKKGYCYNIEESFRRKNGKIIPTSFSCSLLYDNQKKVSGILYIAKDISEIKETEKQLKAKNEELNTFVYKASHDLRAPLTSIMGLVGLVKEEKNSVASIKEYIELVDQSVKRMDSILINLLEITKITQTALQYEIINVEVLIHDILKSLEHLPGYNKINFDIDIKRKKEFKTDVKLLRPIFQNVIENAIKYKKNNIAKSYIQIKITDLKNKISITVKDNGIGIDRQIQENIFKMFFRGNYQSKGSGLGLYIVKTSVEKLGGNITVKSEVNKGTEFTIYLPV